MHTNIKSFLFSLRIILGNYPRLFFLIYGLKRKNRDLFVNDNTELVVSAYPRTANTFFIVALQHVQKRKLNIAHHLHVPALTMRGVKLNIPTIVLIREPYSCITSLIIREKHITPSQAIKSYLSFYSNALENKDKVLIVEFNEITNSFDKIIERINKRFGLSLDNYSKEKPLVIEELFNEIDLINRGFNKNTLVESKVSRPSVQRKEKSEILKKELENPKYKKRLKKCLNLYEILIG